MKANKDPKIEIKECDVDSVHVKLIRRVGDANNPEIYEDIQIFPQEDFAGMLKVLDKQGIGITGYHEMIVVHDPTIKSPPPPQETYKPKVSKPRVQKSGSPKSK